MSFVVKRRFASLIGGLPKGDGLVVAAAGLEAAVQEADTVT